MSRTGQRYKEMSKSRRKDLERLLPPVQHRNQGIPFISNGLGAICQYCKRKLEASTSNTELAATREHYIPQHKGGTKRVWACRKCDIIKGNMSYRDWKIFMIQFPNWWTWKVLKHER